MLSKESARSAVTECAPKLVSCKTQIIMSMFTTSIEGNNSNSSLPVCTVHAVGQVWIKPTLGSRLASAADLLRFSTDHTPFGG
jgi:hypothetical protein